MNSEISKVEWQLAEAKNRFSEVYRRAVSEGRQKITKRGGESVFVISASELEQIEGRGPNFIEFLSSAPGLDEIEFPSREGAFRKVDL